MAEFLRPEVRALAARWTETAIWAGGALVGLRMIFAQSLFFQIVGVGVLAVSVGFLIVAARAARQPEAGAGPGMVSVNERMISYFGPESGGEVSVETLVSIRIARLRGAPHWVFVSSEDPPLAIPVTALGADRLFGAISPLAGVDYGSALAAMKSGEGDAVVIWEADASEDSAPTLH